MRRDGLLVVMPGVRQRSGRPIERREIAEAVGAAYKRLKDITDRLDAQIKSLSASLDGKADKAQLEKLRADLAALQNDVDSMKPWGDDIAILPKLVREFKPDIAAMGEDVEAILRELAGYR